MGFIWPFLISFISRFILVVATWNKKQKILCDPCFHIHSLYFGFSHILFFFFFLMLPLCLAGLDYSSIRSDPPIHQGPYTKLLGFKCPYTCLFLYRKKLQMSTFLVYLYKKKPLRALKHPYTSIHPYTKFCAQILKFCAQILCYLCYPSLSWPLFSLHVSLAYLTHCAQRSGLYYSYIFTVVAYIIHTFFP